MNGFMKRRTILEVKITLKLVDNGENESKVKHLLANRLRGLQGVEEVDVESVDRVDAEDEV